MDDEVNFASIRQGYVPMASHKVSATWDDMGELSESVARL